MAEKGNAAEIDRLALALAKEPGSKAFIPLAEEYGKAGMWQEAAAVLEDGLKAYPNFITAMVALGRVYDQLNQPIKAKALLEEAVKLSPENIRAHRTLAKIYAAEGTADSALRSCQVILSANPLDEEALLLRAALGTPPPDGASSTSPKMPDDQTTVPSPFDSDHSSLTGSVQPVLAESSTGEPVRDVDLSGDRPSPKRMAAAVGRLERWLDAIQSRRRDREPPYRDTAVPHPQR